MLRNCRQLFFSFREGSMILDLQTTDTRSFLYFSSPLLKNSTSLKKNEELQELVDYNGSASCHVLARL